jgi:glycine cleavage system aminomethyltransferase T
MLTEATLTAKTFADLKDWRKVSVTGRDALVWLNGLVTADVSGLRPGSAQRCLLLNEDGGLLADVTIAVPGPTLLLVQDPAQPRNVIDLLLPEVGRADVELEDRSAALGLLAFPTRPAAPDLGGTAFYSPSALGPGSDIVCLAEDHARLAGSLAKTFTLAGPDDLEAFRIAAGQARMGVDALEGDYPAEAAMSRFVDLDKSAFAGRAALAGRDPAAPLRRAVVAVAAAEPVSPGDPVLAGGEEAGVVTSVTATPSGIAALARVRWERRGGPFATIDGVPLTLRDPLAGGSPGAPAG